MKQRSFFALIGLVALSQISGTPVPSRSSFSQANVPEESRSTSDSWVRDNYDRALDLVLENRCTASKHARWITCIRIVPGHPTELEYSLSVEKQYDGTVLAHVTRPKAHSVYTQLCERKKEHPRASVGDLTRLIALESQAGDQRRFPSLVHLADEFEKIRFSAILSDEIMMDPTQYRFRVRSFSGDQMELALQGPGSGAPSQPQILIQWAESAREMLASAFN
jgi:hypothetical protein